MVTYKSRDVVEDASTSWYPEIEVRDGEAHLRLVNPDDSDSWYVLTLTREGKLVRAACLPTNIGLDVDRQGRIKLHGE